MQFSRYIENNNETDITTFMIQCSNFNIKKRTCHKILWNILTYLLLHNYEILDSQKFERGMNLFSRLYVMLTPAQLNLIQNHIVSNLIFTAIFFRSPKLLNELIAYGLDVNIRYFGITPLMLTIVMADFEKFRILHDISNRDLVTDSSSFYMGDRFPFAEGQQLNYIELAAYLFKQYKLKNCNCVNLIPILEFLNISVESIECCVCFERTANEICLECCHYICYQCASNLQIAKTITCPLCRFVTPSPKLMWRLYFNFGLFETISIVVDPNVITFDMLQQSIQRYIDSNVKKRSNNFDLYIGATLLPKNDTMLAKSDICNDSIIYVKFYSQNSGIHG